MSVFWSWKKTKPVETKPVVLLDELVAPVLGQVEAATAELEQTKRALEFQQAATREAQNQLVWRGVYNRRKGARRLMDKRGAVFTQIPFGVTATGLWPAENFS